MVVSQESGEDDGVKGDIAGNRRAQSESLIGDVQSKEHNEYSEESLGQKESGAHNAQS